MKTQCLIYETFHFTVITSSKPHVSRTDGGHLVIRPKTPVCNRWDFDIPRAKALMRLSMLAGEAMLRALNRQGIAVERINLQDNGNWGINTTSGPTFHLHLYGRARGSIKQIHGEALVLPLRKEFPGQPPMEALTETDRLELSREMHALAIEERYRLAAWQLEND